MKVVIRLLFTIPRNLKERNGADEGADERLAAGDMVDDSASYLSNCWFFLQSHGHQPEVLMEQKLTCRWRVYRNLHPLSCGAGFLPATFVCRRYADQGF